MAEIDSQTNCILREEIVTTEESSYETTQEDEENDNTKVSSTTGYPNTSSPSSVDIDKFDAEFGPSTCTADRICNQSVVYNCEVLQTKEVKDKLPITQRRMNGKYQVHYEQQYHKTVNVQETIPMEIPACEGLQDDTTTRSETTRRCGQARRCSNKKRLKEGCATKPDLADNHSKTSYPHSKSDKYKVNDSVESSQVPETDDELSDSIFYIDIEDFVTSIEHDLVATKYGLPYDVINCPCSVKAMGHYSLKKNVDSDTELCTTKSCYNFEECYGKLDDKTIRVWLNFRKSREFRKAFTIYDIFMKIMDPKIKKAFVKSECGMKTFFPYYWMHLVEKYVMYLEEYDHIQEIRSKMEVIQFCERILREQEIFARHYKVRMRYLGRHIKFSERRKDINENFEIACTFLKKEYPTLFVYLIKKFQFSKFVIKRMTIVRNRLKFIKKWRESPEKLTVLELKYRN